jgi:hypothetical protein
MSALREAQLRMARYLRNPERQPGPEGVEARRLKVYRELVYNTVEGFLSSGFPVLHSLYEPDQWQELVQCFIEHHRCQTPYFLEISQEFIQFLAREHQARPCDPPFAAELAHYEWVELALDIAEESAPAAPAPQADALRMRPRLSPLAWLLSYAFPVHRIGPGFRPEEAAEPTFLVAYRDRDESVGFIELNPATARLLELVRQNTEDSGADLLAQLADELAMERDALAVFGAEQLNQFALQGVISLDNI